ncbi:Crp/Fnr family transcriptional regulator [Jannaschia sp.]|nr:Crp/Fnr family transcriptional regulator [Jannaschia sp.]
MDTLEQVKQVGMVRRLSADHWDKLTTACSELRDVPARTVLTKKAHFIPESQLLISGLMGRHVPGPDQTVRQLVALQVPGDFVDLHSFPSEVLDHDVTSVTDIQLAIFPHENLRELMDGDLDLTIALWELTIIDAAIHRHWSYRMGALRALSSVANFLCEMELRYRLAGMTDGPCFTLPMTQSDIGEACGMTSVHVSRMLRDLRAAGCCTIENGKVTILDRTRLRDVGKFDPQFLYLNSIDGFDTD